MGRRRLLAAVGLGPSPGGRICVVKKGWFPDRWTFTVNEISAGVYEAVADDQQGGEIRHVGSDPDDLLGRCEREAAESTERGRGASAD
jgi:hypothetical protein